MTNSGPETLKRKLEDLLRLMIVVWAKESQAIKAVSGELDSGIYFLYIFVCSFVLYLN